MSNMTPFELRLELLKMAKDSLEQDFHSKRDLAVREWDAKISAAMNTDSTLPGMPIIDQFPTEDQIIAKAKKLNEFISQSS